MFSRPVARTGDPATSHAAARAATPGADTIRQEVELYALKAGPAGFIDEEMSAHFDAADSSSYRTRRGELTRAGEIVDSRRRRPNSNMCECIVWVHRTHAYGLAPAEKPLSLHEKLARHANRLDESATQMKSEGRVGLAAELAETAQLIRDALEAGRKAKNRAA